MFPQKRFWKSSARSCIKIGILLSLIWAHSQGAATMTTQSIGATGLVEIVKTPRGEFPFWVRHAFVGLVFPCWPFMGPSEKGSPEKGALTGEAVNYASGASRTINRSGVSVPQEEALRILGKEKPGAARWLRKNGFPKPAPDDCFGFGEDEVKPVSGVERKKILLWRNDPQG